MCYTGICRHENYMGDCCATQEQRRTECVCNDMADEPEEEDDDE